MVAVAVPTSDLSTIVEVLDRAAVMNAEVEAYVEPATETSVRRSMTFAEWHTRATAAAAWLSELGVGANDVVCIVMAPSIDFAVASQAVARVGGIVSGVNPRMGATERGTIFDRMQPIVTLVEDDHVADLGPSAGLVATRSSLVDASWSASQYEPSPRASTDPVAVVWTSGTTGAPKGALFDHESLKAVAAGTDVLSQPGDRRLSPLPFSHVSYVTRAWDEIAHAVTTVISPSPWKAPSALKAMVAERITVAQGVPTQWALLLGLEEFENADLSSLRVAGTGAARMAAADVARLRTRLKVPVVVRYTSTETSLGTGTRPGDSDEIVATTVGRPVTGVEILLVDPEGGAVAPGEVGRVQLRSAASMKGYVASRDGLERGLPPVIDIELTTQALGDDGWVTTGDFGVLDHSGNLTLVGRDNEMYQRGGYNVYPAEVEKCLEQLTSVAAVAVVAGNDPILGEVGVAFVVASSIGDPPRLDDLRRTVGAELADYKAPDVMVVLAELPVTSMGKIDKRGLLQAANEAAAERSEGLRAPGSD
ncbi:MAG: class I adenylate-forming enzyme family protein [Actinomycetes bacterium]